MRGFDLMMAGEDITATQFTRGCGLLEGGDDGAVVEVAIVVFVVHLHTWFVSAAVSFFVSRCGNNVSCA